jgi:glutathione S-transferase
LGLSYEYREVDLVLGQHLSEEYRRLNLFGRIPAIDIDGFILSESRAILRYLARRFEGGEHWYPQSLEAAAQVDRMLDYSVVHLGIPLSTMAWHQYFAPILRVEAQPFMIDQSRKKLMRELPLIEVHLSSSRYLYAGSPTIADLGLLPFYSQLRLTDLDLSPFPNLRVWGDRMQQKASWARISEAHRL